jgi:hypothetical protein
MRGCSKIETAFAMAPSVPKGLVDLEQQARPDAAWSAMEHAKSYLQVPIEEAYKIQEQVSERIG